MAEAAAQQQLQADAELARLRAEVSGLRAKYKAALAQMDRERERADSLTTLQGVTPVPLAKSGKGRKRLRHQATAVLMLAHTGRMVAAMAMINATVAPARRGGFMAANSSIQHVACGVGTALGGALVSGVPGEPLVGYDRAGWCGAAVTLASLWFAARLRPGPSGPPSTPIRSLAAAAEAEAAAGEGMASIEAE